MSEATAYLIDSGEMAKLAGTYRARKVDKDTTRTVLRLCGAGRGTGAIQSRRGSWRASCLAFMFDILDTILVEHWPQGGAIA